MLKKLMIFIGGAAILLFTAWPGYPVDLQDSAQVESLTPSEIHRIMGQAKARQLGQYWAAMQLKPAYLYNQTQFDVTHYGIKLRVDVPNQLLYGDVTITAKALVGGLDTVGIDFDDHMTVDSIYHDGVRLNYIHSGYSLAVILNEAASQDEVFSFSVAYHGHPVSAGFQAFSFAQRNGIPVVSSLSEPYLARNWWPCKDRPDDKADSLDIWVTCDTALYCASNGNLIDTTRHGDGTWTFNYQVRYPITSYLFSVAISKYVVWQQEYYYGVNDSMPVIHHVFPDQYTTSLSHFGIAPYAIGVYAGLFGEYPFVKEKYGHAHFQWGGGMEHQTVTSMAASYFGFSEPVVVHELAHQWWGDMITCNNWHDIWLNEGFASYCEALYYEVSTGKTKYDSYIAAMEYVGGGSIYIEDTTDVDIIFGSIVYDKGAWVLHMLRHIVGDATFFNIMQALYNSAYKYHDITTAQFHDLCETVSGMDLDYFFEEWIYGTYRPEYLWSFYCEPDPSDGKYLVYLPFKQVQTTEPMVFKMPLDIRYTYNSGDTSSFVLFNDVRDTFYIFKTDQPVQSIALDPGNWVSKLNTKANWGVRFIPYPLGGGTQLQAYSDSLVARGGSAANKFSLMSGSLPFGLTLDSLTGVISGVAADQGEFTFTAKVKDGGSGYWDSRVYNLSIAPTTAVAGDADNNGLVNIKDITLLISFLYREGPPPSVPALADPNRSCSINIQDITFLITFLYRDGPAPQYGCAVL